MFPDLMANRYLKGRRHPSRFLLLWFYGFYYMPIRVPFFNVSTLSSRVKRRARFSEEGFEERKSEFLNSKNTF